MSVNGLQATYLDEGACTDQPKSAIFRSPWEIQKTVQIPIGTILAKFQFSIHILPLFLAGDSLVLCHGESLFFHDNISMHLQVELHTKKINVILST